MALLRIVTPPPFLTFRSGVSHGEYACCPKRPKARGWGAKGAKGGKRLSRGQAEGAASELDRLSLDVKISVEFVGPPASNHADAFAGDAGTCGTSPVGR